MLNDCTRRLAVPALGLLTAALLVGGCRHAARVAVVQPVPASAPAEVEPYTLADQLPPKPAVVTPAHRDLELEQRADGYYLRSRDGRCYPAGRGANGELFPVYRDAAHRSHRLYYDADRDRYYRVGRDDRGRFYRCYEGEKVASYCADTRDYDHYQPSSREKCVVTERHHKHSNDAWLLAIPAAALAYVALTSHHEHHPRPVTEVVYVPERREPRPVVVCQPPPPRQVVVVEQQRWPRPVVVTQPAPCPRPVVVTQPAPSPRPIFVTQPAPCPRPVIVATSAPRPQVVVVRGEKEKCEKEKYEKEKLAQKSFLFGDRAERERRERERHQQVLVVARQPEPARCRPAAPPQARPCPQEARRVIVPVQAARPQCPPRADVRAHAEAHVAYRPGGDHDKHQGKEKGEHGHGHGHDD